MEHDFQIHAMQGDGLVGRAFGFGQGDPGSIQSLCITLRSLPRRIRNVMLNKGEPPIEYQLYKA